MKYYAMIDGRREGPFELEELPAHGVRPSTYIWCKGMADWQQAGEVADVCRFFRNRLYDLMHPENMAQADTPNIVKGINLSKDTVDQSSGEPVAKQGPFSRSGLPELPSIEEVNSREDAVNPPVTFLRYAWAVTIFCFFPTGIIALLWAYRTRRAIKSGDDKLAHDCSRAAKMWTGITFFLGIMAYAFLFRFGWSA